MRLKVTHQEKYSRLQLLARTFFGAFYIMLPHGFLLLFVLIWASILKIIAFWAILFTGKYPEKLFNFQVGVLRWILRINTRLSNISDGYPKFGVKGTDTYSSLEVEYPAKVSRGLMLVRLLFGGFFVYLPHYFILFFRKMFVALLIFFAWFAVLFTGKYPASFYQWVAGQLRWETRIMLYMSYLTDKYPAFTGNELPEEM